PASGPGGGPRRTPARTGRGDRTDPRRGRARSPRGHGVARTRRRPPPGGPSNDRRGPVSRPDRRGGRAPDRLRPIRLEPDAVPYAEGSCLVAFGDTRILCAASVEDAVPAWRKGSDAGWVTGEYAMLPRATHT